MNQSQQLTGSCLCGQIQYLLSELPFDCDHCFCRMCQRSVGSVMTTWMDFKIEQVNWLQGKPKEFASSDDIRRGFCDSCGCSMSYRHTGYPQFLSLSVATLEDANLVSPNYHIYTSEQPGWLKVDDNCERYAQARDKGQIREKGQARNKSQD